ncbi:MAG: cupin domain-containing protein [Alphaproteobacteria bacterium]
MAERTPFIVHWTEVQRPDEAHYPGSDELMSIGAPLGEATGLQVLGIHHETIPPGRRTSWPHAERDEEEFVYVLKGTPQVWIDGELFDLKPGDAVGFPKGTGIAHTFLNNSDEDAHVLVVGEKLRGKVHYPLHPERNAEIGDQHWKDGRPERPLGPHDGLPDRQRG